ncbi:MAG: hypothetical protein D6677_11200 [Calditrichaeota bacterium]|nr:MAG: hypothetical protein D6677_11200 [Calditrichota bacterium]
MNKILLKWGGGFWFVITGVALTLMAGDWYDSLSRPLLWAALLMGLNILMEAFNLKYAAQKTTDDFVKNFFRGKLVRVVIILAIFFTIYVNMAANGFIFIVVFFILYFLFQIIEIYIFHTHKTKRF